jgi:CheY-like chemotaxis protein
MKPFRILVVEDDPKALDQIVKLLRKSIKADIEVASNVDAALAMIKAAIEQPYQIAILDFRIPKSDPSGHDEVDESICQFLTNTVPETIVSHMTGFRDDQTIQKHIDDVHKSWRAGGFFLDKRDPEFGSRLVSKTREALYGTFVEREIDDLFRGRSSASHKSGSITNRIADLCLDISLTWRHMNPATKARVKQFFVVMEEADKVSVFLR